MAKKDFGCGRPECAASTGIHEGPTFGTGILDEFGYWEKPCYVCARAWERTYPKEKAWPFIKEDK